MIIKLLTETQKGMARFEKHENTTQHIFIDDVILAVVRVMLDTEC